MRYWPLARRAFVRPNYKALMPYGDLKDKALKTRFDRTLFALSALIFTDGKRTERTLIAGGAGFSIPWRLAFVSLQHDGDGNLNA